jgi:RimJ/RimL family protein N-acetyltransferase
MPGYRGHVSHLVFCSDWASDESERLLKAFETERLLVRRLRRDDLDDFYRICGDPDVMRHMDDGTPLTRERTSEWIDISLKNYELRGWGCLGVTDRTSDRLIGFAGYARPSDRPGIVEIIYAFLPDEWGKGYATEVAGGLIAFGFGSCGLERIEATVDPENPVSFRVLEKIGMRYDGRNASSDGELVDYFSIERMNEDPHPQPLSQF